MRNYFTYLFLIISTTLLHASDDWSYIINKESKRIYKNKESIFSCEKILLYKNDNDTYSVYLALRDAGLFYNKACKKEILKHQDYLLEHPYLKDALSFYNYRLGKSSELMNLAQSFDKDAKEIGDHWSVELFGFLQEWEVSGRRLVRHAAYADGAASEVLCPALMWRSFLEGDTAFKKNWYQYGEEENISIQRLDYFYKECSDINHIKEY